MYSSLAAGELEFVFLIADKMDGPSRKPSQLKLSKIDVPDLPIQFEIMAKGMHCIAKGKKLRRCRQCSLPTNIKRTIYYCKTCPSNPPLHPECLEKYHKQHLETPA